MTGQKISICTVCMNRLHHIKRTLPKNILDNKSYPNLEFVLLDYNSNDGLEEWVEQEMSEYITSGLLKFYRNEEPIYFDRSHSRNQVYKLSSGDIICNVDADNFIGRGFANYVNEVFSNENHIYLVADTQKRFYFLRNAFGRFCVKKDDLLAVGGLDEEMKSYGSETVDFYERIERFGLKEVVINNTEYLKAISHGDEERISNEFFLKSLHSMYIKFIDHKSSEFIILYKNNEFESGFIEPELEETHLPAALKPGTLKKGEWREDNCKIEMTDRSSLLVIENKLLDKSNELYYKMIDEGFLLNVAKNYSFITNVNRMKSKSALDKITANKNSFGKGQVMDIKRRILTVS